MHTQLYLGLSVIIMGICNYFKIPIFYSKRKISDQIAKSNIPIYLEKMGAIQFIIGCFIIVMGQIEYRFHINSSIVFYGIYILWFTPLFFRIVHYKEKYKK